MFGAIRKSEMLNNLSTKAANGQGVSLEEGFGTPNLSLMSKNKDYREGYTVAEREK